MDASALVGYSQDFSVASTSAVVKSVDAFFGTSCEGSFVLESGLARSCRTMGIASQVSTGARGRHQALAVWQGRTALRQAALVVRRFRADDGQVSSPAGGCGSGGGSALASCAVQGNAGFRLRLRHAAPAAPAFLALSPNVGALACTPCFFVPGAPLIVLGAGSTDSRGNTSIAAPLPPLQVGFYLQWIVASASGGGSCLGFQLSDALLVLTD
jgi:hypothetical protein